MGPRAKPSCFSKWPFRQNPLQAEMGTVGHGLPWGCLVWIFSPKQIFYPRYDGNNERKERAGEPYCKPDPHVWMQINLTAEGKAKPECVTFSLLAQLLRKYLDSNTVGWLNKSFFFWLFFFPFWGNFIIFPPVCLSVNMQGEVVPRSGSWNFPSSVVLLLLSFFSCFFLLQVTADIWWGWWGKAHPFSPTPSALDSASPLTGEHLAGHCPSTSPSICLHHSFPPELLGQNYQKQSWIFDVFIFGKLNMRHSSWVSTELNTSSSCYWLSTHRCLKSGLECL